MTAKAYFCHTFPLNKASSHANTSSSWVSPVYEAACVTIAIHVAQAESSLQLISLRSTEIFIKALFYLLVSNAVNDDKW